MGEGIVSRSRAEGNGDAPEALVLNYGVGTTTMGWVLRSRTGRLEADDSWLKADMLNCNTLAVVLFLYTPPTPDCGVHANHIYHLTSPTFPLPLHIYLSLSLPSLSPNKSFSNNPLQIG